MTEFDRFAGFCAEAVGRRPEPQAVELGKIDHLIAGEHWTDKADLGRLLPTLHAALTFAVTDAPEVLLRFRERREDHSLAVTLTSVRVDELDAVRLETIVIRPVEAMLRKAFEDANRQANQVFAALVPKGERQRFQVKEGAK